MLKRLVAVLIALVVGAAVIYGGVSLYRVRHELFRPDLSKVGGTEVTFDVEGEPSEDDVEEACRVLRRRFDAGGAGGVEVRRDGNKRVAVLVPNGKRHEALVAQARRLAFERGAVEFAIVANPLADKDALELAEKQFLSLKEVPVKPGERRGREVVVGAGEGKKRYRWYRLNDGQARDWLRGIAGTRKGASGRWVETTNYQNATVFVLDPPAGGSPMHYVLCLEPDEASRVGGEGIDKVRVLAKDSRSQGRLEVTFGEASFQKLHRLTATQGAGRFSRTEELRILACAVDGEVIFGHHLFAQLKRRETVNVQGMTTDLDDFAALLRGGEQTLKLDRASVAENPVAPRR